jgi:hypothetical protein
MRSHFAVLGALGVAAAVGAIGVGCSGAGSGGPALVVQGTVSQALATNDARAIAIGTDGRTFWTSLDAQRDFTLLLPVGQSYRIVIADTRPGGVEEKIAHLVLQQSWGASLWLGANAAGMVDLGVLKITSQGGGSNWNGHHGDDDDHEGDHDHDDGCHEGGHHGGHDAGGGDGVCSGDGDEPLQPTKNPGSTCEDHEHHGHDHHDGGKTTGDGDDDDDHDHDGDDPPCATGDGGSPAGDGGAPKTDGGGAANDAGSGGGVGAECLSSTDCAPPLTCKAGFCSP